MGEFENLFEDNFFIISSDNLNDVETKLFGFVVADDGIYFNNPPIDKLDGNGTYIYVCKDDDNITIFQDCYGSFGLFVYHMEEYFAISNSLIKLVDFLKDKVVLNLNSDYAYTYMAVPDCSPIYKETLIKEIQRAPQDYIINIDINNNNLNYTKIEYHEKTVPIDSIECLNILDKWHSKWVHIFNSLYKNANLQFSLSGGIDSRVVLSLLLSSNVDFNNINILTFINSNPIFVEDLEIASEIANDFGFNLNNQCYDIKKYYFNDLSTSLNLSFYLRGGFAKQMYWQNHVLSEINYHVRGLGGELLKDYFSEPSTDAYILNLVEGVREYSSSAFKSTKTCLKKTFEDYSKIHEDFNDHELLNIHYHHVKNRHYSCTQITEAYFFNNIILSPLMDPLVNKIRIITGDDKFEFLLPCLIIMRYYPKLLDYRFEGNRAFSEESLALAKKINNRSPFIQNNIKSTNFTLNGENKLDCASLSEDEVFGNLDPHAFLTDIFNSNKFKELFSTFFSKQMYEKIHLYEKYSYPEDPRSDLASVMVTMKIIEDVMFSQLNHNKTPYESLEGISNFPIDASDDINNHINLDDVRLDFKNYGGEDNEVIILDISDDNAMLRKDSWFTNSEGIGVTVESNKHDLDFKLKCKGDGKLKVRLRSRDVWDKNNNRIYIEYETVLINSVNVLDKIKIASHDNPIIVERDVKDGDIFDVYVKWKNINVIN